MLCDKWIKGRDDLNFDYGIISRFMKKVELSHAMYFSKKYADFLRDGRKMPMFEGRFKSKIISNEIYGDKIYDYILIDCAPSLGLITLNSLVAADSVIIPIQCEYFALEGLGKLLNTIKSVQKIHNPNLDIEGLLLTMFDSRLRLSNQVVEEVRKHFSTMVFETIIRRNTRLGEAPSYGESIIAYDATSKGAVNYLSLANEIIKKNV